MSQPEYIAALLSIIVGLGLTDLARSLRELVRPRRKVDWHWLPLLWAATTFLLAIQIWWNSFSFLTGATPAFFIAYLVTFLLLYLTCAFALPDPEWEASRARSGPGGTPAASDPLDLRAYHFSQAHRRWFFGVFIALLVMSQVGSQTARALSEGFAIYEQELLVNGVAVLVLGTLILTDRWWVHAPASVLYFLAVAQSTIGSILGL
jgi:hypothetical protein